MKKELLWLSVPVVFLAGVGIWFRAFPKPVNRDLEGPLRAVLLWQKSAPLTKQEKFERYDTKIKFQFALRGTPDLPSGFVYRPTTAMGVFSVPVSRAVFYELAARNYRFVTLKNGQVRVSAQNQFGVLQQFAWRTTVRDFLDATISAKSHRAPRDSRNFIVFDLVSESWNPRVPQKRMMGVWALDFQTKKLRKWR